MQKKDAKKDAKKRRKKKTQKRKTPYKCKRKMINPLKKMDQMPDIGLSDRDT